MINATGCDDKHSAMQQPTHPNEPIERQLCCTTKSKESLPARYRSISKEHFSSHRSIPINRPLNHRQTAHGWIWQEQAQTPYQRIPSASFACQTCQDARQDSSRRPYIYNETQIRPFSQAFLAPSADAYIRNETPDRLSPSGVTPLSISFNHDMGWLRQ